MFDIYLYYTDNIGRSWLPRAASGDYHGCLCTFLRPRRVLAFTVPLGPEQASYCRWRCLGPPRNSSLGSSVTLTLNSRASVRQRGGYRTGDLIRVSSQQSVPEQTDPRPGQLQPRHPAVSIIPEAFLSSGVQGRSPSESFVDIGPSTTSERLQQHTYEELDEDPFPVGAFLMGGSGMTMLSSSSKTSGNTNSPSGKGG